jgi:hypothetical protein
LPLSQISPTTSCSLPGSVSRNEQLERPHGRVEDVGAARIERDHTDRIGRQPEAEADLLRIGNGR